MIIEFLEIEGIVGVHAPLRSSSRHGQEAARQSSNIAVEWARCGGRGLATESDRPAWHWRRARPLFGVPSRALRSRRFLAADPRPFDDRHRRSPLQASIALRTPCRIALAPCAVRLPASGRGARRHRGAAPWPPRARHRPRRLDCRGVEDFADDDIGKWMSGAYARASTGWRYPCMSSERGIQELQAGVLFDRSPWRVKVAG